MLPRPRPRFNLGVTVGWTKLDTCTFQMQRRIAAALTNPVREGFIASRRWKFDLVASESSSSRAQNQKRKRLTRSINCCGEARDRESTFVQGTHRPAHTLEDRPSTDMSNCRAAGTVEAAEEKSGSPSTTTACRIRSSADPKITFRTALLSDAPSLTLMINSCFVHYYTAFFNEKKQYRVTSDGKQGKHGPSRVCAWHVASLNMEPLKPVNV